MPTGKYLHRKGYKLSEEHRKKISNSLKNKKLSEETKRKISKSSIGKVGYWKNKKMSEETKEKMKKSAKRGSENSKWKGGISKNKEYIDWQKNKRNRLKNIIRKELGGHTFGDWETLKIQYNNTCPCCGKKESEIKLTEDHIIPLSKGGSDNIENIQPLCLHYNLVKHTKTIKY